MLTKQLGNTSIPVPVIGQGAGDLFWDSQDAHDFKVDLLRYGVELGMNLIDTAEEYGKGESERIVGQAIRGIRNKVIVATKFSPKHSSFSGVLKAIEGSLRRLGTDYVDIYQAHWPHPVIPISETMSALRSLLDSGKVRSVGLCNFSQREFAQAQEAFGEVPLVSLQAEYNLTERTIEHSGLLKYCSDNNTSLIAYSPLDQGRLGGGNPGKREVLATIGRRYNKTGAQVCLRWLVSKPEVVAIPRSSTERHVLENSQAIDFDLSEADIGLIEATFSFQVIDVPTDRILVSTHREWNHVVYQTLDEALVNAHGFAPSPMELAEGIRNGNFLKPVKLVPSKDKGFDYELIGGRIRYWAWVIAHGGRTPIPACVMGETDLV